MFSIDNVKETFPPLIVACPVCRGTTGYVRSYMFKQEVAFNWDGSIDVVTDPKFSKGGMTGWCRDCGRQVKELRRQKRKEE